MRLLLLGLIALTVGCEMRYMDPDEWAQCEEDGPVFHTRTDPNHCGGCYIQCAADVPCDDWVCQYNTPLHCGEPHRQCVAPDGQSVACIEASEADGDLEAVSGFVCQPGPRILPDQPARPFDEGDDGGMTLPAPQPAWVGIPGHSEQCHDGLDDRLCQQASVEFADLCGRDVVQPLGYDFEIMTTEVSRGQYRAATCGDCAPPQTIPCQSVCADSTADDLDERDARPITGLNWCEAYTVCQELGGRLPTVQERARVEALAFGSRSLFRQATNCSAWARETGRPPWLAECFDESPAVLGFDRVDGLSGHVLLGVDVLQAPLLMHHLIGNVDEWLADPAYVLTTGALLEGPRWWSVATNRDELGQPRLVRGRSVLSPSGQPGNRTLVVEPSVRADDVGVRCARTVLSPYDEPVPYPFDVVADDHAACLDELSGLRPVREMSGQLVYRAAAVCIDVPLPTNASRALARNFRQVLVSDDVALARLTQVTGDLVGLGLARFTADEQWWIDEPVKVEGAPLRLIDDRLSEGVEWHGETSTISDACREQMTSAADMATDGHVQRRELLTFTGDDLRAAWLTAPGDIEGFACAHFDCAHAFEGECATGCEVWQIPVAIAFDRAEPFDRAGICDASTANPAER